MMKDENATEKGRKGGGFDDPPEVTDIVVVGQPPSEDDDERPGRGAGTVNVELELSTTTKITFDITNLPSTPSNYKYRVIKLTRLNSSTPLSIPTPYDCLWDGTAQMYVGSEWTRTFLVANGEQFNCTYQIYQNGSPFGNEKTDEGTAQNS